MSWYCARCNTGFEMAHERVCPICFRRLAIVGRSFAAPSKPKSRKGTSMSTEFPQWSKRLVKIANRDHWVCGICGEEVDPQEEHAELRPTIDHIHPRSKGGNRHMDNLQLAHSKCNNRKGNQV